MGEGDGGFKLWFNKVVNKNFRSICRGQSAVIFIYVYGFGSTFIKWIQLLYKEAAVKNNGLLSEYLHWDWEQSRTSPPLHCCFL